MTEPGRWRTAVVATWRGVRDGWLMLGIALCLFGALEGGYRLQAGLRRAIRGTRPTAPAPATAARNPYADSAWFRTLLAERSRIAFRWEPFVYSRHTPSRGRYVNSDSGGLRVVPRYRVPGGKPIRVFAFGGSTTWGFFDRDSNTAPAVEARQLAAAGYDAEVVNFGQLGYVSAQEVIALVRELRRGNIPDAVIFLDGVNDVSSARANGTPGVSYREFERATDADFNAARRARGLLVDDATALRTLASHSSLLARLFAFVARPAVLPPLPEPVAFCRGVMGDWLRQAQFIDHLASAYGFVAIVIWQPQWETSDRPRTAFERFLEANPGLTAAESGLEAHRRECARVADSLVAAHAAESMVNLARLFAADTGTVFLDRNSHTSERTTAIEADTITSLLVRRLARRSQASR